MWTSTAFVEEARVWVEAQLARRGSRLTGQWRQPHAQVWSSTIRFETTEGRVWFRDAYLEPFTGLRSRQELLRCVALARSTGCVTRALSWERALQDAPRMVVMGEDFPVRGWLLELLEPWADLG